jgi:site-specific DNA recombinase
MIARAPRPERVAIYARVSSAGQEENSSLDTQEAACRSYAAQQGWDVAGVYREIFTGAELFDRPQLGRLRESVKQSEAEIILAYALDRVSRNQAHLGFLLSEWDHHGARLVLVTEELDETPEGRLLQSVRGFVAEMERLKIRERTQRGTRARVEAGKPLVGCRPPYGYRWRDAEKSGLVLDPDRAPVVRRIFDAALQGASLRSICRSLMADGIPTPTGRSMHWEASVLHDILTHPIYTGQAVAFRHVTERRQGGKKRVELRQSSDQIVLPADVAPAIITPQEQQSVLARLEVNKLRATRNNRDPEATLLRAGFARCGYCRAPLAVKRDPRKARPISYYRCSTNSSDRYRCPGFAISAAILDTAVWDAIKRLLKHPDLIAAEVERRLASNTAAQDLTTLDRRLQEVTSRQTKLARLASALDDDDAAAPLLTELRFLASQKRQLEAERQRMESEATAVAFEAGKLQDLASWCGRVASNLETLSYEQKRLILEALDVRARVWRTDHDPRWQLDWSLPVDRPVPDLAPYLSSAVSAAAAD